MIPVICSLPRVDCFDRKDLRDLILLEHYDGTFSWWRRCGDYCEQCSDIFSDGKIKIVGMIALTTNLQIKSVVHCGDIG